MLSGLYGDLPQAKSSGGADAEAGTPASAAWTAPKFAPVVRRQAPGPSPLVQRRARPAARPAAGDVVVVRGADAATTPGGGFGSLGSNVKDEYDPARPNDYEEICREREQQRRDADAEAERQEHLRAEATAREAEERERAAAVAAAAPPDAAADRRAALDVSGDEAYARRARPGRPGSGFSDGPPGGGGGGMGLAARMMEKMGWKEGQGLGRARQGMVTPLVAQKTDARSGVIVNAAEDRGAGPPEKRPSTGVAFQGAPTRVILLRNMVGPGDVDDDLEDEVGGECGKYGTVTGVLIFEVTEPGFPAEQAVRIFVQFDRTEAATRALVDLEGRFFGGRTVRATFFDEGKFERQELAPVAGEQM